MTIDHDAIAARVRQNREAGTPGPWALSASGYNVMRGKTAATVAVAQPSDFSLSDARRISALPDLEAAYLALYDEVKRLRAERDEALERETIAANAAVDYLERAEKAEAERDRVAAEWAETSQRNYQRAKAAEARVAKLVEAYDATNPLRTADMHHADCKCLCCEVDDARQALKGDSDE